MARMRPKKNLQKRLDVCKDRWFENPEENKGRWREVCGFPADAPVYLEIGCGKGKFAAEMAVRTPDALYIAVERDASCCLLAMEKAHKNEISNLFFMNIDAQHLIDYFEDDEIDKIYLNFSDPWTRQNKPKRRLTYRTFLAEYKKVMKKGSTITFKTDNDDLFDFSVAEFAACGFELSELTRDLHNSEFDADNVRTEFEQKFADQGINIKRVVATYVSDVQAPEEVKKRDISASREIKE